MHKVTELKSLLSISKQFAGASSTSGLYRVLYRGLYKHSCPSRWGFVFLHSANPHLPPPQPVYVVVGLYIDRCITIDWLLHTSEGWSSIPSVLISCLY